MSVLEAAIGWLAPPQCVACGEEGSALCKSCSTSEIVRFGEKCWRCNALSLASRTCDKCKQTGAPSFVWITTHHEELARELLSLYKFGHQRAAAGPISSLMSKSFIEIHEKYGIVFQDYLVVPVPTATSRIRERSFGHSELLARKIALNLRLSQSNALRRIGQSRQLGSKREDRLRQLTNKFNAKSPDTVKGRKVLLIDDVTTTGGTLVAAAKTLRGAGAKRVDALVFAKRL